MKIAFAGGGSLGPVTPLLAVANAIKQREPAVKFMWFGTQEGPERALIEAAGIPFFPITVAKFPRYPSMRWLTFPFDMLKAKSEVRDVLSKEKPHVVMSAGGFTAVPVIRVASYMGISCAIHQLDATMSWSNKAVENHCKMRTTSFAREGYETVPTPTRFSTKDLPAKTTKNRKTVFIVGGGTGSGAINEAVSSKLDAWLQIADLIHVAGKGKMGDRSDREGYSVHELLEEAGMKRAFAEADLVITRAGIGGLSDISACSKTAIIVPIPGNQQEENAQRFEEAGAGVVVHQGEGFADRLLQEAERLLNDSKQFGNTAHDFFKTDDGSALAERILGMK